MEQSQSQQERSLSVEKRQQQPNQIQQNHRKCKQQRKEVIPEKKYESESQTQKKNSQSQKTQQYLKVQSSLQKISIQTPMKISINKNQPKNIDKPSFSLNKIQEKNQKYYQKDRVFQQGHSSSKNINPSSMKSTLKSNYRQKTVNKPFYEETFYITGMKQNYLLLLSDNNQVLEFPIGMFTTQGGINSQIYQSDDDSNEGTQRFHLMKDIKIGQPIKIKLELDIFRQDKDEKMFNSLQKKIHEDYSEIEESRADSKNKQSSKKKFQ